MIIDPCEVIDNNLVIEQSHNIDNDQYIDYDNTVEENENITDAPDPAEKFLTIKQSNDLIYENQSKEEAISSKHLLNKVVKNDEITEEIKKFLIKDLIHPSIVDGCGFRAMLGFFGAETRGNLL